MTEDNERSPSEASESTRENRAYEAPELEELGELSTIIQGSVAGTADPQGSPSG